MISLNQLEALSQFNDQYKEKFNPDLFCRSDDEVMSELQKVIKSCERTNNSYFSIEVLRFRVVDDYAEINKILFDYYEYLTRNKPKMKKKDNQYGFINMNDSAIRLLIVTYRVAVNVKNNLAIRPEDLASGKVKSEDTFDVYIAVPRVVDRYYFKINGIMRSILYQIVDGSTYNNNYTNSKIPNISFKIIFMAARVFRYSIGIYDEFTCQEIRMYNYRANIFNKTVCVCNYFLAKYGFYGAMKFLGIEGVYITDHKPEMNHKEYCFKKADNLYIMVDRFLLENDLVTQSFVSCLYLCLIPGMYYNLAYTTEFWVRILGGLFNRVSNEKFLQMFHGDSTVADTYNKGLSILDSFENIYDESTKEDLRLKPESKADMYCVLRWILREFYALKKKDNYDVSIKRIRFGQYVAATYIFKVIKGINRVSDQNNRITTESIKRAIRTDPMYLVNAISKSNLVTYRNMVSDMDGLLALKYTLKGISGIGETDSNSIPDSIRFVHPSHLGRLDLDASSDNNPGITGMISPFIKLDHGYFSDKNEPDSWDERYQEMYEVYKRHEGLREIFEFKDKLLNINTDPELKASVEEATFSMRKIVTEAMSAVEPTVYRYPFVQDEGVDTNGL